MPRGPAREDPRPRSAPRLRCASRGAARSHSPHSPRPRPEDRSVGDTGGGKFQEPKIPRTKVHLRAAPHCLVLRFFGSWNFATSSSVLAFFALLLPTLTDSTDEGNSRALDRFAGRNERPARHAVAKPRRGAGAADDCAGWP